MSPGRWRPAIAGGAGLLALALIARIRPSWLVRAIRAGDHALEIASPRGAALYAVLAPRALRGVYRLVVEEVAARISDAETVVDLGCGPADLLAALARRLPRAVLVGAEPSEAMRTSARARLAAEGTASVTLVDGTAEDLPLPSSSVHLVVSTLSAHHWRDPVAAFGEIDRVLRPGGEALIYDVRFATYGQEELDRIAGSAGLDPRALRRSIAPLRLGPFHPLAVITYRRP